ncbi:hypothetical protein [Streptomyces chrestomyceticus]|uniref:hypothetical protein n=1 Tax=Streptomyces chrestomyceticus TaxID=68185 RepID=UPI0035A81E1E
MPNRYVKHERHGRLDLKKADLGVPGGAQLLERLLADRRLPVSTRGVTCAEICETLGFEEPMYLYRRLGGVVASHTGSTAEDRHHGAGESDEHKAYKARAVRAAEEGGHSAVQERPSRDRKIRSDVLIRGADGLLLGFESQLSKVNPRDVAARDAAARRAGVEDAWQTDSRALAKESVVPWLRTDRQPMELIMKRDSPLPFRGGIRRIDLIRCDERYPGPCPERRTGKCRGWHPSTRPAERPFDDFIRDAASGLYVRAKVRVKRLAFECWTPAADYDAYLDATAREVPPVVPSHRHARRVMGDGDPCWTARRRVSRAIRTSAARSGPTTPAA